MNPWHWWKTLLVVGCWIGFLGSLLEAAPRNLVPVGVARVDISPTNAVPLMGYAARARLPAPTNLAQRIHARALAIGSRSQAAVLITIDNCILPGSITDDIRSRLARRVGLTPAQVALTVTHTHSAPCLTGAAPNIFARDLIPTEQEQIAAYTAYFTERLEEAARLALDRRRPARLSWGRGFVGFAKNRRTPGGPVDHDLPLLRISDPNGELRAVLVSYACHCTTLSGELNAVHGDWAGAAAEAFERDHPGAVALVAIGAGADANPEPRGTIELAARHGEALAAEAARLVKLPLQDLPTAPVCRLQTLQLPFQPHFTREEWTQRSTNSGIVGFHARRWLARMDRGETLSPTLPYPVQTWVFGDRMAMVFLGGEVVVDYSLRLKRELDPQRLWVNAYANDVPCYIPSRRILDEGGYEAETSLWYYDRPQRLSPAIEDQIVEAVRGQLPKSFRIDPDRAESPPAKMPEEALRAFRTSPGFEVQLVAAEPLLESPVAIDFGPDGRVWVAEMRDYPSGLDGQGKPGGRVRVLTDADGDGRWERSEVVVDGVPFPTGLMCWGDGVLVCAAPDVWWFRPGPGGRLPCSGERLLSGFATHNFQARVNGLRWGLDGWVYGSGGLFGGTVMVVRTGQTVDCRNRDFRFRPDTGEFEALGGVSQQGRVRDDFGNEFGNDNGTLLWHFPIPDRYLRDRSWISPPAIRWVLPGDGDVGRVFPISRTLTRFNEPGQVNRLTSACGPEIYRDRLLGESVWGDAFVCEPVHNLVRRARLIPEGVSFRTERAEGEESGEFLASADNWFRPVEVRTGPDGALWVVDFARFVVEHPRWIPPERLKSLDVRAGAAMGRLWRVHRTGVPPRPVRNLSVMKDEALATVLGSPNGIERDWAQRLLVASTNRAPSVRRSIEDLTLKSPLPAARAQSAATLRLRGELGADLLDQALADPDPRVQRMALTCVEGRPDAADRLDRWKPTDDAAVLYQAWLTRSTLGLDPGARADWMQTIPGEGRDPWLRMAWMLGASADPGAALVTLDRVGGFSETRGWIDVVPRLLDLTVRENRKADLDRLLVRLVPSGERPLPESETWAALQLAVAIQSIPTVREALERETTGKSPSAAAQSWRRLRDEVVPQEIKRWATKPRGERSPIRSAALIQWMGWSAATDAGERRKLVAVLDTELTPGERRAVVEALGRVGTPELMEELLAGWDTRSPSDRAERLGVLLSREAWTGRILEVLARGGIRPAELAPAQRQKLLQNARPEWAARAREMLPGPTTDRTTVMERFRSVRELPGNPEAGRLEFEQRCAVCHRWRGRGHAVGPDLASFRFKSVDDFLGAILDPNAAVEPRYAAWTIDLKEGRSLTGVIRDETSTGLTVVEPGGQMTRVNRDGLARLVAEPHSLMPEGLESGLEPQALADLIAWLKSGPGVFGQATEVQTTRARQRLARVGVTPAAQWSDPEPPLPYPSWLGVLPLHVCRLTDGRSRLGWTARSTDGVFRWPAAMGFWSQPAGAFSLWVNGREALSLGVSLEDAVWNHQEGGVELRYQVEETSAEDSNGILELRLSTEWAKPGEPVTFEVRGGAAGSQRWFGIYGITSEDLP